MRSTRTESQFCAATPISSLCTVSTFHFHHCLRQSPHLLKRHLAQVITLVAEWIDTYGIHHGRVFEGAIESWLQWDLNPQTLIPFRHSNRLSYQAMRSTYSKLIIYIYKCKSLLFSSIISENELLSKSKQVSNFLVKFLLTHSWWVKKTYKNKNKK